jgi:hypothetical protein
LTKKKENRKSISIILFLNINEINYYLLWKAEKEWQLEADGIAMLAVSWQR